MLKKIALVIGILLLVLFAYAATKPDTFAIERSTTIGASPDKVFPLIENFHNWSMWSPFDRMDPTMVRTFSGPQQGVGAVYGWEGNKKVGKGRMEIIEATPPSKVVIQLDFLAPFESRNTAEFTLQPEGDSTHVTWAFRGPNHFMSKVMSVFVDMDKLIGKDFEAGLDSMKAVAEQ